ncbi:hypothetical protein NFJ02_31g78960 [Pycnococcus provasolii]
MPLAMTGAPSRFVTSSRPLHCSRVLRLMVKAKASSSSSNSGGGGEPEDYHPWGSPPQRDLKKYRRIIAALYLIGGTGHALDFIGKGPFTTMGDATTFAALTPTQQLATVLWATLGPAASLGLTGDKAWGDAALVAVAILDAVGGFSGALGEAGTSAGAAQVAALAAYVYFARRAREDDEKQNNQ